MRFIFRAFTGAGVALLCAGLLILGARPYLACAPGLGPDDRPEIFGWTPPISLLGGAQCAWPDEARRGRRPAQERVYAVRRGEISYETAAPRFVVYGEVRASRALDLRAPAAGRLVALSADFQDGARIAAGEELFSVDPADPESVRADAEAGLSNAVADAADAERAKVFAQADLEAAQEQRGLRETGLRRQETLARRGTVAASTVETAQISLADAERAVITREQSLKAAETRVEQTQLAVRRAEIALEQAERDVGETAVRAPFDGVLRLAGETDAAAIREGRRVSVNEQLGVLVDPASLEVAARFSNAEFGRVLGADGRLLALEGTAVLTLGPRQVRTPARLVRASAQVDAAAGGRIVFAALQPADFDIDAQLRPGDFVALEIQEPPLAGVARVPARAVDASSRILLVAADGRLSDQTVEVVRREGDWLWIRGPEADATFVLERAPQLGDGILTKDADAAPTEDAQDGARGERGGEGRRGRGRGEGRRGGDQS